MVRCPPPSLPDSHAPFVCARAGEPQGLCAETAPGSGVFRRTWSKATVEMNCNTQQADIAFT